MSNIITKAHPVPDMHSTGLRVVGAWLFAIVLILFSTVFVHVPYTREIQMVLAIPVLLFSALLYAGAWKGNPVGRNNIDRLVALTTSVAFSVQCVPTLSSRIIGWASGWKPHVYYGVAVIIAFFPDRRVYGGTCPAKCVGGYLLVGRLAA